jgi:hypothetical protein
VLACADFDHDGDVDLSDFAHFQACFGGPDQPVGAGCVDADLEGDGDCDLADFGVFVMQFTGPQ